MAWYQIIAIVMITMNVVIAAAYHGKSRWNYNVIVGLINAATTVALLNEGGFWE